MKIKGKYFLNNQEFFDAAWEWLITKATPACVVSGHEMQLPKNISYACIYHDNVKNRTCVIGAFIPEGLLPDEASLINQYCKDNKSVSTNIDNLVQAYPNLKAWFKNVDISLLRNVQLVHDYGAIDQDKMHLMMKREQEMKHIASRYKLTIPTPEPTDIPMAV